MVTTGATTPLVGAALLTAGQTSPMLAHDEGLEALERFSNRNTLKAIHTVTPPGSPADGDLYYVEDTGAATGAWAGQEGKLAFFYSGWIFVAPVNGDRFWLETENCPVWYYTPDSGTHVFWIRDISDAPGFASSNDAFDAAADDNVEVPVGVDRDGAVIWIKGLELGAMPTNLASGSANHNISSLDMGMTGHGGVRRFDTMFSNGTTAYSDWTDPAQVPAYNMTFKLTSSQVQWANGANTSMTGFDGRAVIVFTRSTGY